jgi:microcystin-dependent protein
MTQKSYLFLMLLAFSTITYRAWAQAGVGIGVVTPDPSAVLHIQPPSNNKGLLIPRLTTNERNTIGSPVEGLLVYDTDANSLYHYNGGWQIIGTPPGGIIMWSGSVPPSGWALCDGGNGTPDLRGRFIVSAGQNASPSSGELNNQNYAIGPGSTGRNSMKLTTAELPTHNHPVNVSPHSHTDNRFSEISNDWKSGGNSSPGNGTGTNVFNGSTSSVTVGVSVGNTTGGDQPFDNRPPYYALAFIMKL